MFLKKVLGHIAIKVPKYSQSLYLSYLKLTVNRAGLAQGPPL